MCIITVLHPYRVGMGCDNAPLRLRRRHPIGQSQANRYLPYMMMTDAHKVGVLGKTWCAHA